MDISHSKPEPCGTFACPICGVASVHQHTGPEIAESKDKMTRYNGGTVAGDRLGPMLIGGLRIIEDDRMTEMRQTFIPNTKKRRIQDKARRNPRNWGKVPCAWAIMLSKDTVAVHPDIVRKLREEIAKGLADAGVGGAL